MISVIFYGRNDNHGYNLHKRASLSLNNVAELLSHENDEILFVDWNTSSGLPTFIESIHDLLTEKAKDLIKTIKVDFYIHDLMFGSKTNKQTVEPVARNVAIVRSNPKNKWILSTNTDMIFIPKNSVKSLSDICSNLEDGFYELPRFSLPEIIWETFNRLNPQSVMSEIKELRLKIDLDEIVTAGPILRYDAPGDFQLCLRSQLFDIRGFDENMVLGWHVDSNLCRRLNILNGETKSLENELYGYHCEHTKVTTHFTAPGVQNNLIDYVEKIENPYLTIQDKNWGLSDVELSEFNIREKIQNRFEILFNFASPPQKPRTPVYANLMGNLVGYSQSHAIPYLVDSVYDYPLKTEILYFGPNDNKFNIYRNLFDKLGFSNFTHFKSNVGEEVPLHDTDTPRVIILDLGFPVGENDISSTCHEDLRNKYKQIETELIREFLIYIIRNSQKKSIYKSPFITLNVETYDNGIGSHLRKWINLPNVAANSRVRIGFLKKPLINRNTSTLKKMARNTLDQIDTLGPNYFKGTTINSKMINNQGIELYSHEILRYSHNFSGLNITRRGLMLQKSGFLEIDLSKLDLLEEIVNIIELDRPRTDGNNYEIIGNFEINGNKTNISFKKNKTDAHAIKFKTKAHPNNLSLIFDKLNYNEDHKVMIRMLNVGVYKLSKIKKKMVILRASDLRSRYFLEDNWSYSNENLKRWTTDSTFTINLNKEKRMVSQLVVLEIKHFKNSRDFNFIKEIRTREEGFNLRFIELPRINRKRGRLVSIFLPRNCDNTLIIETSAEPYDRYEIHKQQERKLYSAIGVVGVAEGKARSLILLTTFPFFILWVKAVGLFDHYKNKCRIFIIKKYRGVSIWKT